MCGVFCKFLEMQQSQRWIWGCCAGSQRGGGKGKKLGRFHGAALKPWKAHLVRD